VSPNGLAPEYQQTLLAQIERFFSPARLSKPLRQAFLETPRHHFVARYYSPSKRRWVDTQREELAEHLRELYSDHPLCLFRDDQGRGISTISQPSLVLYMLHILKVQPGMEVFELGAGSGWNAALLGKLAGAEGRVLSVEILPELVGSARRAVSSLGLQQVEIREGDGNIAAQRTDAFDRGIFTASAWDLPACFYSQLKKRALLLFVLKALPHLDLLATLRKREDGVFESEGLMRCSFVPVTGTAYAEELEAIALSEASQAPLSRETDWSECRLSEEEAPSFIEFARLVFDCQRSFLVPNRSLDFDEEFWGISCSEGKSLVLFNEERLQAYGSDDGLIAIRRAAKRWRKAGRPDIENLRLSIHMRSQKPRPGPDQWLCQRGDSCLLWSL